MHRAQMFLKELFADDAVSIEPEASPAFEKETKGLPAILEKGKKFNSMVEKMHSITVSDPLVGSNSFAVTMRLDVTMKHEGHMDMTELCIYKVKNGKIVCAPLCFTILLIITSQRKLQQTLKKIPKCMNVSCASNKAGLLNF